MAILWQWDNDADLVALYGGPPSELALAHPRHAMAVEVGGRFVGLIGLSGFSRTRGSAEVHIVIGEEMDRGRGLGRAALRTFLAWAFATLGLEVVFLRVLRGNSRAVRCFESCGFQPFGVLHVRSDPRYASPPLPDDVLLMTCFRLHLRAG